MRTVDLIQKKRDGFSLQEEEIRYLINGYTQGTIPDYQIAAFAMAVYFRGMNGQETAILTDAMARSGELVDLSAIQGIKVDKHSTGGVGDKTTLIVGPLVAACGVPVAKMSGRGLGHTGGTIDKLESIPGFQVELSREQFIQNVNEQGLAIISQSGNVTPADKKLYGLRDVTATVDSIPLIASSVMSKKIASGADAIVLDVKYGNGAFMKRQEDAETLARAMVEIGKQVGKKTIALISGMNQPLGYAVGNALEVKEAIQTLQGEGPDDLTELSLMLAAWMIFLGGKASSVEAGRLLAKDALLNGSALASLKILVQAQGGEGGAIEDPELYLPKADKVIPVCSLQEGYVGGIDTEKIGLAAMKSGAGRETKDSSIDPAAGILLYKKTGDFIKSGEVLAEIHCGKTKNEKEAAGLIQEAFHLQMEAPLPQPLIAGVIEDSYTKEVLP